MSDRWSPPVPAVLVSGLPGAGKSVLGAALAARLGAALLDQDTLTGPLVAVIADLVGGLDLHSERAGLLTRGPRYETLFAVAEDCLSCANPVVLVAPFTQERRDSRAWQTVHDRLSAAGGTPRLVWADAPPEVLRRRLIARAAARDTAKLADLDAFEQTADWLPPQVEHRRVDTTDTLSEAELDALCQFVLR